jgi:16S rRNA (guanine527-N7)-methyltransferase
MGGKQAGNPWISRIERVLDRLERATSSVFRPTAQPTPVHALSDLLDLVVGWNERIDLTGARDPDQLVDLFLADAALLARAAGDRRSGQRWIDVGSGAGAPGVPLALLAPELELTLIEPREKRVAFLRSALGRLGRPDVRVERKRSSQLCDKVAQVAVSRATFAPPVWLAEGARLARCGVWVLLARGQVPTLTGWRVRCDIRYEWPLTGVERRAVLFEPSG